MIKLFYKTLGVLLLVCLTFGITYSKKETTTQNKFEPNILAKCKKVYEDIYFLNVRFTQRASYIDFMPFSDWLVNNASYAQQK